MHRLIVRFVRFARFVRRANAIGKSAICIYPAG
jgi:hypothetical protein